MRVALELQPCKRAGSGIGAYTYELARRLKNQDGLEFYGHLFNFAGRDNASELVHTLHMPIQECRRLHYGIYRRIWKIVPIAYDSLFEEKADLTIFFDYIVPPRINGAVITAIHDMTCFRFPDTVDKKNFKRIVQGIQYSLERSSHILTDSEFSKREILELLHVPGDKISVIYAAPSLSEQCGNFQDFAKKWKIRSPYLLYVGTIEPRKNLIRLLKAFDLLKERHNIPHQLVLAGGKGWKTEEIYRTASEIRHAEDVTFTGYVSPEEKNALYRNADVFVFPSIYEGFGMPTLEAMHHGCPVVCSNAASLPEVVGNAAELVDPMDVESITEGIRYVLSDHAYAKSLVEKGHAQEQKFTWEASAQRLMKICKEVMRKDSI